MCPAGFYPIENRNCMQCRPECKTCKSYDNCTSCVANFWLYNYMCNTTCPENYFFKNNATWVCDKCHISCLQCSAKKNYNCLLCNQTWIYPLFYQKGS